MTALSWEHWVERYTQKGFKVVARSWPDMEGDIEELRRNPSDELCKLGDGPLALLERRSAASQLPNAVRTARSGLSPASEFLCITTRRVWHTGRRTGQARLA